MRCTNRSHVCLEASRRLSVLRFCKNATQHMHMMIAHQYIHDFDPTSYDVVLCCFLLSKTLIACSLLSYHLTCRALPYMCVAHTVLFFACVCTYSCSYALTCLSFCCMLSCLCLMQGVNVASFWNRPRAPQQGVFPVCWQLSV